MALSHIIYLGGVVMAAISTNIKKYRLQKNMSQVKLGNKAHLAQEYISNLENGKKTNPSYDALKRIAKALGVSVSELIDDDEPEQKAG